MAIKHYLTPNSYSVIESIQYSKKGSFVRFFLHIYSDETKQLELANKHFEIFGSTEYRELGSPRREPPDSPVRDESYYVPQDAIGEWETKKNLIAIWDGTMWSYWHLGHDVIYYSGEGEYYFKINEETGERIRVCPLDDKRLFLRWFSPDKVFSSMSNLHKQCYDFLRTQQGFENTVDC